MTQDRTDNQHQPPDASDVVEGPIGSARLKDPASSGPNGADLDALPRIEGIPAAGADEASPPSERTS
jgi:hypothetical protein